MQKVELTRCCICGTGLSTDVSVELGIGPVCGKKYHVERKKGAAENVIANAIMARIVANHYRVTRSDLDNLAGAGFPNLADAIARVRADFYLTTGEDELTVSFDYDPDRVDVMRAIPRNPTGKRWDPKRKVWRFDADAKSSVWAAMNRCAREQGRTFTGYGPKGFFVIDGKQ